MTVTLDIQQPQPFDLVGSKILIAGNATAFEGTLSIRVSSRKGMMNTRPSPRSVLLVCGNSRALSTSRRPIVFSSPVFS